MVETLQQIFITLSHKTLRIFQLIQKLIATIMVSGSHYKLV